MIRYLVLGFSSIPLFAIAFVLSNNFDWNINIVGGVVVIGGLFLIDAMFFQKKEDEVEQKDL